MTYSCTLDLKPDSTYTLHCDRHMWKPIDIKNKWSISKDTLLLVQDSLIDKILIKNNLILNTHFGNETTDNGTPISYHPIYYVKQKSYYKNSRMQYEGKWYKLYKNQVNPKKHGIWRYYLPNGELDKLEIYKKGKLRRTISDSERMYKILNKENK